MAKELKRMFGSDGLTKTFSDGNYYWLKKSWDMVHGGGWFVQIYDENDNIKYGFHKTNKFTAVKLALADKSYLRRKYAQIDTESDVETYEIHIDLWD